MTARKKANRPTWGGIWDKLGNRFETRWTVRALTDLLDRRAESIWLEPISEEGFEFRLTRSQTTEHHQCKRQLASPSDWHLNDLVSVLETFAQQLRADPAAVCIFASAFSAADLANLCLRATLSVSSSDFYSGLAEVWRPSLRRLEGIWHSSDIAETWEMLCRVRVETISEDLLVDLNQTRLRVLVGSEKAVAAAAVLFEYVYEHTTQEVSAQNLWQALSMAGIRRLELGRKTLRRVEALRKGFAGRIAELAIPGIELHRTEAGTVISALEAGEKAVLLIGEAGIGKSHVLEEVTTECERRNWPWLPVSLDAIAAATTSAQLGKQLELDGSPADVLAQLGGASRVLVLDQLDAVSAASGRQVSSYDAIRELLADVAAHENVQVVIACRQFDYGSDDRLRSLMERTRVLPITIEPLAGPEVTRIVGELGFDASRLGDSQLTLLSSPLHLYLLSQVHGDNAAERLDFSTEDDLYGLYWTRKHQDTNRKLGRDADWTGTIDRLVGHMNRNRRLWAPVEVLDADPASARAMASEHVLTLRSERISFFHETFFDYCFARRFAVANSDGLVTFLLANDQELFRRAQVRAVLIHLRRSDWQRYLTEVGTVLTDARVRFHLKHVVASLLGALDDPSNDEWERLKPLLEGPQTSISDRVVRMVMVAPRWQEYLLGLGWIEQQLAGDGAAQARGVNVAISLQRRRPDLVVPIIVDHLADGDPWPLMLRAIVGYGSGLGGDRGYFEAVLRMIETGILDEPHFGPFRTDIWSLAHDLVAREPQWACELLQTALQRRLVKANSEGLPMFEGLQGDQSAELLISQAAAQVPLAFAQKLVPVMLSVMANFPSDARPGQVPRRDMVWRYRVLGDAHTASEALLKAMEAALQVIVNSSEFDLLRDQLESSGYETANYLVARAYAHAGPARSAEAVQFILTEPERLELSLDGNRGTAASQVIHGASPTAPAPFHRRLVALILGYEQDAGDEDSRAARDRLQFRALSAVAPRRRGPAGSRRIRELRQQFGIGAPPSPTDDDGSRAGWVQTPSPPEGADEFTDLEWIAAIQVQPTARYWTDDNRLMGGTYELANFFERQFENNPTRFAGILLQLPNSVPSEYFEVGLRAATKKIEELEEQTVWSIVLKCEQISGRPVGRSVLWLIQAAASKQVPDEIVEVLEWHAAQDSNPETGDEIRTGHRSRDLLDSGINSGRGATAEAMAALLRFHPERLERLLPAIRQLVSDTSAPVRACAAGLLNVVLHLDLDAALELIPTLGEGDIGVLGTAYARRLLVAATRIAYERIAPTVERMAASEDDGAGLAAGEALAIQALLTHALSIDLPSHPSAAVRRGAAAVFAYNVQYPEYAAVCSSELIRLFSDADDEVRQAAAGCFRQLPGSQLVTNRDLCIAFARSEAYEKYSYFLLRGLAETPGAPVDVVVEAADQFIRRVGGAAGDIRQAAAADASDVSVMLIRAYSQNPSAHVREQALDAIDRMLAAGAFGVEESIEAYRR
jgi:hypothetical protein